MLKKLLPLVGLLIAVCAFAQQADTLQRQNLVGLREGSC